MEFAKLILPVLLCTTLSGYCQNSDPTSAQTNKVRKSSKIPKADWAAVNNYDASAHVYFPDYYTFYDANKGGYIFWKNGQWSFTPTMPPYMSNADLKKARVQILKGLSIDLQPELDYPRYMKLYPPIKGADNMEIPVPTPTPVQGN